MGRFVCCMVVVACSTPESSELVIGRVEPGSGPSTMITRVRIEGSGFHLPITSDLDEGSTVVGDMAVTIGDVPLGDAVWRGEQLIEGTVPMGLAARTYDVTVTLGGRSGLLVDGYRVIDDVMVCSATFLDVCMQPVPTGTLDISSSDTINTDTDMRCQTLTQPIGGDVCLVYASEVTIGDSGSLTATGSRPLAIASTSTMTIAGTIDVSSRRTVAELGPAADDASCTFMDVPEADPGGAGGGAGGSFGASGGNGGTGDTDSSIGFDGNAQPGRAGPIAILAGLRGGCRGQNGAGPGVGGAGGSSGGALYLYAIDLIDVTATGQIRATGAGGAGGQATCMEQPGGGGGGTGGLVVIESTSITLTGQISANGGGGSEGAGRVGCPNFCPSLCVPTNGQPGADATYGTTPAAGGMGMFSSFGFGGAGGAGSTAASNGTSSVVGGGGGGGGVGIIKLIGASTGGGVVSPPPS